MTRDDPYMDWLADCACEGFGGQLERLPDVVIFLLFSQVSQELMDRFQTLEHKLVLCRECSCPHSSR